MTTLTRGSEIERYNHVFYERCWQAASLLPMPGVDTAAAPVGVRVEIGCGLRPRLPVSEAIFVDISHTACAKLQRAGADAICANMQALPFATGSLAQVYLFETLEHIDDDLRVVRELARVTAPGGLLVLSTPLHAHLWQDFDQVAGHVRRYEPQALVELVGGCGFKLEGFAPFGLQPRSSLLTRIGAYYMVHWPRSAFWWQEHFLRLAQRNAQPTQLQRISVDDFVVQAATADCAVTAWRLG